MDHMVRPELVVLPESALVPARNLIWPPPNQFTHQVMPSEQPFYYDSPSSSVSPDGVFELGKEVVLLRHDGGQYCHVADGQGLYVATLFNGLKQIVRGHSAESQIHDAIQFNNSEYSSTGDRSCH